MTNEQVVGASQVANLTGGTAAPDSLEAAAAAYAPQGTTTAIPRLCEAVHAHVNYLKVRRRAKTADAQPWEWMSDTFTVPDSLIERVVQSGRMIIGKTYTTVGGSMILSHTLKYDLGPIEAKWLFPALEQKYGKFFFTTDFAEEVGIDLSKPDEPADLDKVGRILPYATELSKFGQTAFPFTADHYLALLLLQSEHQEFMTGFVTHLVNSGKLRPSSNVAGNLSDLCNEIKLNTNMEQLLAYGETVGQTRLKQYIDMTRDMLKGI